MHDLLFMIAGVAYSACAIVILLAERPRSTRFVRMIARVLIVGAIVMHLAALIGRGIEAGRLPIQNQYESMTAVALFAAVGGLVIAVRTKRHGALIAGFIAASLILIAAHDLPIPGRTIEPEAPILSTASLLKFHVTTVIAGYGLSAVGGGLGLAWLLFPRSRVALAGPMALAARLTFWVLGVGILLGAWWAHGAWGRWWAFDAKETSALITWLAYFLPVHAAAIKGDRAAAPTVAVCNLVGMLVMLWSYFGVNLLLISLHSYA